MFNCDIASKKIAEKISLELNLDKDKKEVIAYGIFGLLQTIISVLLVVIAGYIFGVVYEALIISISIAVLRKSAGGVHATSPGRCAIIGTFLSCAIPLLYKKSNLNISLLIGVGAIVFIFSYYQIYKVAPVDTPNKRIRKEERRKLLKRKSIINLSVYLMIYIVIIYLSVVMKSSSMMRYAVSLCVGIILQTLTLTKIGHRLFHNIDVILSKFIE